MSTIGKRLAYARKLRKLSQVDFAKLVGKTQAAISAYETDSLIASEAILRAFAKKLKVDVPWLRYGIDIRQQLPIDQEILEIKNKLIDLENRITGLEEKN